MEGVVLWSSPLFPTLSLLLLKDPQSALLKFWLPALGIQRLKYQLLPSCLICISKGLFRIGLVFHDILTSLSGVHLPGSVAPTLVSQ